MVFRRNKINTVTVQFGRCEEDGSSVCVGERFTVAGTPYQENLSIGVVKEIKLAFALAVGRKCR
jgi:hypothetical protein